MFSKPSKKIWPVLGILALIFIYLLGLYTSFQMSLRVFPADPDGMQSLILWEGIQTHGWGWITHWVFIPSDWLIFPIFFHFLGFLIFGDTPWVPLIAGWLIFVISIFISSLIAYELKTKYAPWIIPILFLFTGTFSYHFGFVSYAVSHNATNLLGLLASWLFLRWIKNPTNVLLALIFLVQLMGGLSDPWMLTAYTIPMAFVTALFFLLSDKAIDPKEYFSLKNRYFVFFLVLFLCIFLDETRALGLFNFVLPSKIVFSYPIAIKTKILILTQNIGGFLNFFPDSPRYLSLFYELSFLIVFILILLSVYYFVLCLKPKLNNEFSQKKLSALSSPQCAVYWAFLGMIVFSVGITCVAFSIIQLPCEKIIVFSPRFFPWPTRYLVNLYFLLILFLIISIERNWKKAPSFLKYLTPIAGLFLIFSGITSDFNYLKTHFFSMPNIQDSRAQEWIQYLEKQNLNYGYGHYWEAAAYPVTLFSHSKIVIRPVFFWPHSCRMDFVHESVTFKNFYESSDWPKNQKNFFVIFTQNDSASCLKSLSTQFGPPFKILHKRLETPLYSSPQIGIGPMGGITEATILVWDHPLLPSIQK